MDAAWLHYESACRHGHHDGMNLGLFARELDLLPEFGYPPVQFGGWRSPRALWYTKAAAHNTVVVDGKDQSGKGYDASGRPVSIAGLTTLWAAGQAVHGVCASSADMYDICTQYERTVFLVDVSENDFYLLDVFRVVRGSDHAKFTHSHFGTVSTQRLTLQPAEPYGFDTQTREFRFDPSPPPVWGVNWRIEDRYELLPPGKGVHFRYLDLTTAAEAWLCEAWVATGHSDYNKEEAWIPYVMTRRRSAEGPLASTFVAVMEAYENTPNVAAVRRLPLVTDEGASYPDAHVAVEVTHTDGDARPDRHRGR